MEDDQKSQVISLNEAKFQKVEAEAEAYQKVHQNRLKSLQDFLIRKLAIEAYDPHLFIRIVHLTDLRSSVLTSEAGMAGLLPVIWRTLDKCTELFEREHNFEEFAITRKLVKEESDKLGYSEVRTQAEDIALACDADTMQERRQEVFRVLGEKYKVPEFIRYDLHDIIQDMMKYSPFDMREDIREWGLLYFQFIDLFSLACHKHTKEMMGIPASTWGKKS